ncbi:MAG TPA: nucleotide exchange factor GrpE [Gemmataceae bacterium]|jgi:molecular chaperone GrpE|nr:nucleotide exchange factor GrpE [Gemmataceae bacterium]
MPELAKVKSRESHDGDEPEQEAASAVLEDLEALRNRLGLVEQQRDEYLALLKRTRADFENYQKRIQRDLAEERRYAYAPFVRELLPVVDNLQRALDAAQQQGEKGPLVQGVSLILSQLLEIFNRFGIKAIDPLGQRFDPNLHQAVLQEPRPDLTPGTVVRVLEPGYRLHDRVLRPAKVVVAGP